MKKCAALQVLHGAQYLVDDGHEDNFDQLSTTSQMAMMTHMGTELKTYNKIRERMESKAMVVIRYKLGKQLHRWAANLQARKRTVVS